MSEDETPRLFVGRHGLSGFTDYIDRVMEEDEWTGERPTQGCKDWEPMLIAYIEWLRERSQTLKTFTREYP